MADTVGIYELLEPYFACGACGEKSSRPVKRDFLSLFVDDLNLHLRTRETLAAPFAGADFIVPTR